MVENEYQQTSEYEDIANYKKTGEIGGIREISLRLFNNAMSEGSKEMTEAGIIRKLINGEVVEIMRPNQKEVYINSVSMLHICLIPKIKLLPMEHELYCRFGVFEQDLDKLNAKENKLMDEVKEEGKKAPNPFRRPDQYQVAMNNNNKRVRDITTWGEDQRKKLYDNLLVACSFMLMHLNYFDAKGSTK